MPGKEEKFMEALLVSLMKRGKGTPKARKAKTAAPSGEAQVTRILEAAGIAENEKEQFENIVKAFGDAKNPLVIAGPSLTVESNGTRLAARISMLKGHSPGERLRLLLLKTCGNSAGAWKMRIPSSKESGRNAGWKGGMLLLGGEREPQELPPFLHELEFLAVVTPYLHDTLAQYAHVLLPSPSWAEREGTFTSLDGQETAYAKRILDLPEGVRDAWRTLIDLGKGTGSLLKMKKWDQLRTKAREMDGW
jgi:NADH dehydrogenase/NADH:ubiquinone oxidoreductase subunit G